MNPKHNRKPKTKPSRPVDKYQSKSRDFYTDPSISNNFSAFPTTFDPVMEEHLLKSILVKRGQTNYFMQMPDSILDKNSSINGNRTVESMDQVEPMIYQLKISIKDITPPIWRRILIWNTITLDVLHDWIMEYFGWDNSHLHEFRVSNINNRRRDILIGPISEDEEEDFFGSTPIDETEIALHQVFAINQYRLHYTYDFGDSWDILIQLEQIYSEQEVTSVLTDHGYDDILPICIKAKGQGPPEDCGGVWGYMNKLEMLSDPDHPEAKEILEWLGDDFDPKKVPHEVVSCKFPNKPKLQDQQNTPGLSQIGINIFGDSSSDMLAYWEDLGNPLANPLASSTSFFQAMLQNLMLEEESENEYGNKDDYDCDAEDEELKFNFTSYITRFKQLPQTELTEWKKLVQLAIQFGDLAPWTHLYDNQLYGIQDHSANIIQFCSVMGNLGEHFAIAAFPGEEGLLSYYNISNFLNLGLTSSYISNSPYSLSNDDEIELNYYFLEKKCMVVSFERWAELSDLDQNLLTHLQLKPIIQANYHKKASHTKRKFISNPEDAPIWPKFASYQPFQFPKLFTQKEVNSMAVILQESLKNLSKTEIFAKSTPRWFGKPHIFPIFHQNSDEITSFQFSLDGFEQFGKSPPSIRDIYYILKPPHDLTKFEARIRRLEKKLSHSGIWEVGDFAMREFTQNDDEWPYLSIVLVCADKESNKVVAHSCIQPNMVDVQFYDALLHGFQTNKRIPTELHCATSQVYSFLQPLCQRLNIRLSRTNNFTFLNELAFNSEMGIVSSLPIVPLWIFDLIQIPPSSDLKQKFLLPNRTSFPDLPNLYHDPDLTLRVPSLPLDKPIKQIQENHFYSSNTEKTLFDWYLFELALVLERSFQYFSIEVGRLTGFRKSDIIPNIYTIITENMETLTKLSHDSLFKIPKKQLQNLYPQLDKNIINLLSDCLKNSILEFKMGCHNCPVRCLSQKTSPCSMFDTLLDP